MNTRPSVLWCLVFHLILSVNADKTIQDKETLDSWFEEKAQCHHCRSQRYEESFQLFDKDKDGLISKQELGQLMHSLGRHPSVQELEATIAEVDADENGAIDFEEFEDMMEVKVETANLDDEMRQAFEVFDKDKSGTLTADEMHSIMHSLGENLSMERVREMIEGSDVDGDGGICYTEFKTMLTTKK